MKTGKTGITEISNFEGEEDSDDEEESNSIVDKLKEKFSQKKSVKKSGAKAKPKSFISKPIAVILALGVFLFLFGEDLITPEKPAIDPEAALQAKIAENKKKQAEIDAKAVADTSTPVEASTTDTTIPVEATTTDTTIPVEATTTDTTIPVEATTTDTTIPVETTEVDTSTPVEGTTIDTDSPVEFPTTEAPMVETSSQDTVDGETAVTSNDDNMTDKILEDLEKKVKESTPRPQVTTYVAPPDYEFKGRGLVYNCVGKHWACVDAPSYRSCEDNSSSTKFLNKRSECHPFNVYQSQGGCEKIQYRMVSSSAKTAFCNGN